MTEGLANWWDKFQWIFDHPLMTLGDKPLTLKSIFTLIILLFLILVVARMFSRALRTRILSRTHLDPELQYAIGRFAGYCFISIGFLVAMKTVGLDLSSLAVIAGAIGIGVGFGLQNVIGNFVSGLVILAERPIAIGHRVEVGGVAGRVTKINLRSTTVVTNDNITIIVPNSDFITQSITNWSHGDPKVRLRLPVGVAYGSDVPKLKRVLLEVASQHPAVLQEPAPSLFFIGFGDSSLDFELGVWTIDMAHNPIRFRSELYYAIEQALRDNNIEIPFPQRDLHLRSGQFIVPSTKSSEPQTPQA